jgi:hypothetical protein
MCDPFTVGAGIFSVFLSVHTNTGFKPASFSICIGGSLPRVESGQNMKLKTHFYLVSTLGRMRVYQVKKFLNRPGQALRVLRG